MKFKSIKTLVALIAIVFLSAPVMSADYDFAAMSVDELNQLRGTMRDIPADQQEAFRAEWQKRLQTMNAEDRAKYRGKPDNAARDGEGMRNQYRKQNRQQRGMGNGKKDGSGRRGMAK